MLNGSFNSIEAWQLPARWGVLSVALVISLLAPTPSSGSSEEIPAAVQLHFAVESIADSGDRPVEPSSLEITVDGRPQVVESIHSLSADESFHDGSGPWSVSIYFDAPLLSSEGLRRAADALRREAGLLLGLGPVEIALADPMPKAYSPPLTDAAHLQQALSDLKDESISFGELVWLRERFRDQVERDDNDHQAAESLRRETELLKRQRTALLDWVDRVPGEKPRLLILVQDGFDLNPRSFYQSQPGEGFREDPRLEPSNEDLARTLAVEEWVVVAISLGSEREIFADRFAGLSEIALDTGGTLIRSKKQLEPVLSDLARRFWVTLTSDAPMGGWGGELEVRDKASGRRLKAPRWVSATTTPTRQTLRAEARPDSDGDGEDPKEMPVIELLRPAGLTTSGPTRFHAIASHRRVDEVAFSIDGLVTGVDSRPPYSMVIDVGSDLSPHTVRAIAFDTHGTRLGEDEIEINRLQTPPDVVIEWIDDDPENQKLEVAARVESDFVEPARLDFYLNDRLAYTLSEPPFIASIDYEKLGPRHFVRVVARFDDGGTSETAQMATALAPIDELDVNTIEILATVTSRRRDRLPLLSQSDFVVLADGDPVEIDHFSRSDHLPLAVGLLLDTSDSMDEVIDSVGQAAEQFFQQALGPEDVAFVVDFDTRPKLARAATGDTDDLIRSIRGLEARGNTALYDSIAFSLQQFDANARRKALVVVTDGLDSTSQLLPRRCIEQARHFGVPIYLVVIGAPPTTNDRRRVLFTDAIARQTGGRTFYLTNLDRIDEIYAQIGSELRSQYLLAVTTERTLSPKELEKIQVEVLRKDLSVRSVLASQQQEDS